MLYFAYGSNMEKTQMRERCPEHQFVSVAELGHYALAFTRHSERWGGGVADLLPNWNKNVFGVLYEISTEDLKRLDQYTSHPQCYNREDVIVLTPSKKRLPAMTYFANREGIFRPSQLYLSQILKGARDYQFPAAYITYLEGIKTTD